MWYLQCMYSNRRLFSRHNTTLINAFLNNKRQYYSNYEGCNSAKLEWKKNHVSYGKLSEEIFIGMYILFFKHDLWLNSRWIIGWSHKLVTMMAVFLYKCGVSFYVISEAVWRIPCFLCIMSCAVGSTLSVFFQSRAPVTCGPDHKPQSLKHNVLMIATDYTT